MPQRIEVPGLGLVEFPDGMTDAQMAQAIKRNMGGQGGPAPALPPGFQLEQTPTDELLRQYHAQGGAIPPLPPGFQLDRPQQSNGPRPVTDPNTLSQLNGGKPVTDPETLRQLNGDQQGPWTEWQNTPPPGFQLDKQSGPWTQYQQQQPDLSGMSNADLIGKLRTHYPQYNDMPDTQLLEAMRRKYGGGPKTSENELLIAGMGEGMLPTPRGDYPTMMRELGALAHGVDTGVRQLAKGVPVIGSYLDEANAATNAALGQGNYEQNLAAQRGRDKQFEAQHPYISTGLQLGGGVASGGALMKAAPAAANIAFGNVGGGVLPRVMAGATSGAALGGAHGFGAGEGGLDSRLQSAGTGAALGATVGAVVPAVASTVAAAGRGIANRAAKSDLANELGVSRGAATRLAGDAASDRLTPQMIQQRAAELGPEGMTLDYGRNLQGRAEALAGMPGGAQNTVLDAVENRVKATADRLGKELDGALGQSPDIVGLSKNIDDVFNAQIKPAYDSVMSAHPQVWDDGLQRLTRRPSIQKAINDAVTLARESGDDIASPFIPKNDGTGFTLRPGETPNLRFWDYTKKALDSRIGAMTRNPDPDSAGKATLGALLDTKRALVDHLDKLTGGQYAKARGIASDKFAVQEALESGLGIFQNKLLPEQFREMLGDMGHVERTALAAGARRAIQRMQEVSPTSMSEGGRAAYRELLQGGKDGDTAQKLRMLLGDQPTDALMAAAKREQGFQQSYNTIGSNSRTQPRLAAQADMANPNVSEQITITGLANRLPLKAAESLISRHLAQGAQRTRNDAANVLTAQGSEGRRMAEALANYNTRTNKTKTAISSAMLQALLMGPGITQTQRMTQQPQPLALQYRGR